MGFSLVNNPFWVPPFVKPPQIETFYGFYGTYFCVNAITMESVANGGNWMVGIVPQ